MRAITAVALVYLLLLTKYILVLTQSHKYGPLSENQAHF